METQRRHDSVFVLLYALAATAIVVLAYFAGRYPYFPGDHAIAHLVQSIHFAPFDYSMRAITFIGTFVPALAIVIISAGVLVVSRRWWEAIFVLLTLSADVVNVAVKEMVGRQRPGPGSVEVLWSGDASSFPSGHVTHFVVFYGFLFFLVWTEMRPSWRRTALLAVFGFLVALVGVSRVYVGAHWPSDVLGGYLIGGLLLAGLIRIYVWAVSFQRIPWGNGQRP